MPPERGFAAVEWIAGMALVLAVIVATVNVVVVHYVQGAVQFAVDEAARHGSAVHRGLTDCEERAREILRGPGGVLTGPLGSGITIACRLEPAADPPQVVAAARGVIAPWLPGVPEVVVEVESRSVVEPPP